jgi:hypothetical protein
MHEAAPQDRDQPPPQAPQRSPTAALAFSMTLGSWSVCACGCGDACLCWKAARRGAEQRAGATHIRVATQPARPYQPGRHTPVEDEAKARCRAVAHAGCVDERVTSVAAAAEARIIVAALLCACGVWGGVCCVVYALR